MNRISRIIFTSILIILPFTCLNPSADGQMIKEVLRRMDRDQNGYIGPDDEMTPQLASLAEKYGYNPNDWLEISAFLNTIEERNSRGAGASYLKKLPGFGNGNDGDSIDTPGFGTDEMVELTDEELYSQFSEDVLEQMQRTLNRLDDDGNGYIDQVEAQEGNWRNPPFEDSDLNGDGAMTRTELARRYHAREVASGDQDRDNDRRGRRGRDRDDDDDERDRERDRNDRRENERNENSGGNRTNSRPAPAQNQFSNANPGAASQQQRIQERAQRYVDGMFTRYDKNSDGVIDEEEKQEMRRPPTQADSDGDGQFTREEVYNFSSGAATQQQQRVEQQQQESQSSDRGSGSTREPRTSYRERRRSGAFTEYDRNNDGQIQMNEFAEDWDGAVFEDYRRRDQNNDGVITPEEWNSSAP
ncbi:MAG: hypothetical protein AAF456_11290 [Planctomycetota bacterium]